MIFVMVFDGFDGFSMVFSSMVCLMVFNRVYSACVSGLQCQQSHLNQ